MRPLRASLMFLIEKMKGSLERKKWFALILLKISIFFRKMVKIKVYPLSRTLWVFPFHIYIHYLFGMWRHHFDAPDCIFAPFDFGVING